MKINSIGNTKVSGACNIVNKQNNVNMNSGPPPLIPLKNNSIDNALAIVEGLGLNTASKPKDNKASKPIGKQWGKPDSNAVIHYEQRKEGKTKTVQVPPAKAPTLPTSSQPPPPEEPIMFTIPQYYITASNICPPYEGRLLPSLWNKILKDFPPSGTPKEHTIRGILALLLN
jgi:hypothetical protein